MSAGPAGFVGIDVGGTKTLAVVVDQRGEIVAQERRPTQHGAAALIDSLAALSSELRERMAPDLVVRGVGVGMAGLVDPDGVLRRAPNLVDADEFPVRERLEARVGLPVVVDNDANCAGRAELHAGAAVGARDALLVTLGTGIGGALIVDGQVVRGAAGMAGEPGHMMVDPAGPVCVCGLRGCWERYASGSGLAHLGRMAAEAGELPAVVAEVGGSIAAIEGEHLTQAARRGDPEAEAVLDRFAWWVAVGLANCAVISDPSVIVVGGGLVRDWDLFGSRVVHYFPTLLLGSDHRPAVPIVPATAGEAAGALGAALLALTMSGR